MAKRKKLIITREGYLVLAAAGVLLLALIIVAFFTKGFGACAGSKVAEASASPEASVYYPSPTSTPTATPEAEETPEVETPAPETPDPSATDTPEPTVVLSDDPNALLEPTAEMIAGAAEGKLIKSGVNTILREKYDRGEQIHINDIIMAAQNDDNLSIELIEEVGEKLGKAVAFLINTFNPETVIVGGNLAAAGDYIMLPLKSSTNKYSLNLVYKDTKFRQSKMGENANAWGVAMLIHNKIIGL